MGFITEDRNKNEAKFKFQGQYARSQRWFDLGFDYIEVNFSTREPDLYKKLVQRHDDTPDKNIFKIYPVRIGNAKCVETFKFHNYAPMVKYFQKSLNICCLSSLAADFARTEQTKSDNAISLHI